MLPGHEARKNRLNLYKWTITKSFDLQGGCFRWAVIIFQLQMIDDFIFSNCMHATGHIESQIHLFSFHRVLIHFTHFQSNLTNMPFTGAHHHVDSVSTSRPRSAPTTSHIKFLCSHGGKILPHTPDAHLKYVGGETRVISVRRDITFHGTYYSVFHSWNLFSKVNNNVYIYATYGL